MVPLIAAGASFLMAKASGASNKQALLSGILSGVTAGAAGAIGGQGAFGFSSVPETGIGKFLASDIGQFAAGTAAGTLPVAMEQNKMAQKQAQQLAKPFGGEEAYTQAYNTAVQDMQGLGQRATYDDQPTTNQSVYNFQPPMFTAREGGIAEIAKYREGGVNYLPSKIDHDEKDVNNYVRATGYVEDGSGNGDKDEDTMLAQLADGEFVSRADAVLGAGIMSGANPNDFKEMRKFGAKFFYNQQDQMKRIYDLVT